MKQVNRIEQETAVMNKNALTSALAGSFLLALAGCGGGLSSEEQALANACQSQGAATEEQCACLASEMGEALSEEDMDVFAELLEATDDDMFGAMVMLAERPDGIALSQRMAEAGQRAERACREG
ncbi:hypothetical protein [Parvularcula oceani]|uniref:hypothetical protein n=1 Tax=Parvularcula oceani TaxID=1247963 RepID=UPI0012DD33BC|nr:hypothetical protein [Parvularcula oceani]